MTRETYYRYLLFLFRCEIYLTVLYCIRVNAVQSDFHFHEIFPIVQDSQTWSQPPRHEINSTTYAPVCDVMRIHTVFIKNPEERHFYYATLVTPSQWKYIEDVVNDTLAFVRKMITGVRRMKTPVVVPRRCRTAEHSLSETIMMSCSPGNSCTKKGYCRDLDIPEKFSEECRENGKVVYEKGPGVETDLLLFISVAKVEEYANAIGCQRETDFDRAVAGRIILSYDLLKQPIPPNPLKTVIMHELFHILLQPLIGFSYRIPETEMDKYHDPFEQVKEKWKSANGIHDHEAVYLKLPSAMAYVREYFNCSTLEGVLLHNFSDYYTDTYYSYAHFDNRIFPDALMAPSYSIGNQVSKLEVFVLQDTGWYRVNVNVGRELTLTKGKGCDFVKNSCYEYMDEMKYQGEAMYPYCQRRDQYKWICSLDHKQVAHCAGTDRSDDIEESMYRLNTGLFYHSSKYYNYCPMVIVPHWLSGDTVPYCTEDQGVEFRELGAVGGRRDSMCMKFLSLNWKKTNDRCPEVDKQYVGVCVRRNCLKDGFSFLFGGQYYFCPKNSSGEHIGTHAVTTPDGCEVSFSFCCPMYDVCSHSSVYNSSIMKLGECGCNNLVGNFFLVILSVMSVLY